MTGQEPMQPAAKETFRFACLKELPCFTRCCADLKLVLTPYDILRLKTRLHLSSEAFLDRYTAAYADRASGLPLVRLKMQTDATRNCPFLTPDGCGVYADRPGACRLYPLGQAASKRYEGDRFGQYYFKVKESHCMGWHAEKTWTIQAWLTDQGLDEYNPMNDAYLEINTGRSLSVLRKLNDRQLQMYYTACYNLDVFRDFVFKSSFRHRFDIKQDVLNCLETDDAALMTFALRWLKFSLFNEPTFQSKTPPPEATGGH